MTCKNILAVHSVAPRNRVSMFVIQQIEAFLDSTSQSFKASFFISVTSYRGGGRSTRLVRPFKKNLNLTIIGPTRTLKIQDFDHKYKDFWSDQGRTGSAGPELGFDPLFWFSIWIYKCSLYLQLITNVIIGQH